MRIGREADLVVVAPATADLLAKAAHGLADDLLTTTLLTATCPVLMAPAMHTEMWQHPATRANVATLRARGVHVLEPASGRLTGADTGPGRLPEPEEIFAAATGLLGASAAAATVRAAPLRRDLAGRRVVVSAGGTREHLDPVRFLGNRSSGRQGYALARTAAARGAEVVLVAANTALPDPGRRHRGAGRVGATSCATRCSAPRPSADAVVMAAAVADFRPRDTSATKIKKGAGEPTEIALVRNPDVLAELAAPPRQRPGQVVVGFAAETGDAEGDVLAHGRAKLARKGCDLLVVNEVGAAGHPTGFEGTQNAAVVLGSDGSETPVPLGSKEALAEVVWDLVAARWASAGATYDRLVTPDR